ncbi:hypothetical protein CF65_00515 [Aggregatibacter actinomycetemcomitans HK1651]|nr:hypothetical protein CF65_00515 [Aggregatibacter actinomycetemcomitans HK1651]
MYCQIFFFFNYCPYHSDLLRFAFHDGGPEGDRLMKLAIRTGNPNPSATKK